MRGRGVLLAATVAIFAVGCAREKSTDELLADAKSQSESDRLIAVRLLSARKPDPAKTVPVLIEALRDKDDHTRRSAAIGLGGYGEQAKDAIPALQAVLKDHDVRVRDSAATALHRIAPDKFGPPSKPVVKVH